ncbi:unnamed protein product [Closterium sp. NIES-65]|nr:unnamed protein product [Closterium sp. NIES-65]
MRARESFLSEGDADTRCLRFDFPPSSFPTSSLPSGVPSRHDSLVPPPSAPLFPARAPPSPPLFVPSPFLCPLLPLPSPPFLVFSLRPHSPRLLIPLASPFSPPPFSHPRFLIPCLAPLFSSTPSPASSPLLHSISFIHYCLVLSSSLGAPLPPIAGSAAPPLPNPLTSWPNGTNSREFKSSPLMTSFLSFRSSPPFDPRRSFFPLSPSFPPFPHPPSPQQESWRRPKGIDSRVRRKFKGTPLMPNIGYGSNKKTRHMLRSGFQVFRVHNERDVELLLMHNRKYVAQIASAVSTRKRKAIVERAQQLDVKVINGNARLRSTEDE